MDTSITHIRPRFEFQVPHPQKDVLNRLEGLLKKAPKTINGRILNNLIVLNISDDIANYWSPQLNFRVEVNEDDENKSMIAGLIGPKPEVWTLFMFFYFSIGIIGFFASSYGIAKYSLGEYTHLIWSLPAAILIMLTAYKAGKYGEQKAVDQIEMLKQFVREAIIYEDDKIETIF